MAISDTYSKMITEQIIQDLLESGENPYVSEITEQFETFTENNDISQPLFIANNYHIDFNEISSAAKNNNANLDIYRDLKVLYRHLLQVSNQAIVQFDRWRSESKILESRLNNLEERINSLLLFSSINNSSFSIN